MSNLKKKEPLSAFIAVKTTESMKKRLAELASKDKRDFSDYLRIIWEEHLELASLIKKEKVKR